MSEAMLNYRSELQEQYWQIATALVKTNAARSEKKHKIKELEIELKKTWNATSDAREHQEQLEELKQDLRVGIEELKKKLATKQETVTDLQIKRDRLLEQQMQVGRTVQVMEQTSVSYSASSGRGFYDENESESGNENVPERRPKSGEMSHRGSGLPRAPPRTRNSFSVSLRDFFQKEQNNPSTKSVVGDEVSRSASSFRKEVVSLGMSIGELLKDEEAISVERSLQRDKQAKMRPETAERYLFLDDDIHMPDTSTGVCCTGDKGSRKNDFLTHQEYATGETVSTPQDDDDKCDDDESIVLDVLDMKSSRINSFSESVRMLNLENEVVERTGSYQAENHKPGTSQPVPQKPGLVSRYKCLLGESVSSIMKGLVDEESAHQ